MPASKQDRSEPSILIWAPAGETPTAPAFEASSAVTFGSLSDAIIHAEGSAPSRSEKPWILTSGALFGPDQIRALHATIVEKGTP